MSSCTWMGRLISKLLCWHMSPCPWMGRLISSATLLAYVLVYSDGAAHIYCFSVSICPRALGWGGSYLSYSVGICLVHLDGAPHIYSYFVSICHRAL
ncbi:hypothetical protein DPMN_009386 [Dreissena polymorpha]|uniref:Uncharacterized protein n=1 Tax=Dreissena polymorpha TaxID=45954 RepID=A0A9D4MWW7_DREPO|nr:hypothetical protein DPMN_009386 [Dreissena polymorpha]